MIRPFDFKYCGYDDDEEYALPFFMVRENPYDRDERMYINTYSRFRKRSSRFDISNFHPNLLMGDIAYRIGYRAADKTTYSHIITKEWELIHTKTRADYPVLVLDNFNEVLQKD